MKTITVPVFYLALAAFANVAIITAFIIAYHKHTQKQIALYKARLDRRRGKIFDPCLYAKARS